MRQFSRPKCFLRMASQGCSPQLKEAADVRGTGLARLHLAQELDARLSSRDVNLALLRVYRLAAVRNLVPRSEEFLHALGQLLVVFSEITGSQSRQGFGKKPVRRQRPISRILQKQLQELHLFCAR